MRYSIDCSKVMIHITSLILFGIPLSLKIFQISKTFEKSHLRKGFIRTTIDGFSSGSLRVFFKVLFDKRYLNR